MQVNKQEYDTILRVIEELENIKHLAEREFDEYCMNISFCGECPLNKNNCWECTARNYYDLKDKGEI